jgi:hypothetical protein
MGKLVALGGVFEIGTAATIAPLPVLNPQTPFPNRVRRSHWGGVKAAGGVAARQRTGGDRWTRSDRGGTARVRTGQHVSGRQCIWRLS